MDTNRYADMGKRFIAYLIDSAILGTIGYFAYYLINVGSIVIWLAYFGYFESSNWMATPGKRAMGIVVTDIYGRRISVQTAIIRNFCKLLSTLIIGIGFIMALFSEQRQSLHDMMASTLVLDGTNNLQLINRTYGNPMLLGLNGSYAGQFIPIGAGGLVIGRDASTCNVIIPPNISGISRIHCRVGYNGGSFILTDVGSSYGTYLSSGIKLTQGVPVMLKPNEQFYLASRNIMFEVRL